MPMVCPDCGEKTHRSRARGIRESALKRFAATRFYRCRDCGWRGKVKSEDVNAPGNMKMTVIVWVAGVILALVIGFYGVNRMNASVQIPPTTDVGDRR